jgi:hypothetical protein
MTTESSMHIIEQLMAEGLEAAPEPSALATNEVINRPSTDSPSA